MLGAVAQVGMPVEYHKFIFQAMAGLGIVAGIDLGLHLDGERHVEALVIAVILGHYHMTNKVYIGGAVGRRLDLQIAKG